MAASWAFPLVGLLVGVLGALALTVAQAVGLPDTLAVIVAVAAAALLTGALHEDGLADFVDGVGGGRDPAAKIRIMRDSRIGTYGVVTLILVLAAKIEALVLAGDEGVAALMVAHVLGRAVIPAVAWALPFAAEDGLARLAGRPGRAGALWSVGLALALALALLPAGFGLIAAAAAVAAAAVVGWLARRYIGGMTGDVLGAAEQAAELAALVAVAACLSAF